MGSARERWRGGECQGGLERARKGWRGLGRVGECGKWSGRVDESQGVLESVVDGSEGLERVRVSERARELIREVHHGVLERVREGWRRPGMAGEGQEGLEKTGEG